MSKPFSIRTEPWAGFDKQSYGIITDDFVHERLFTLKVVEKLQRDERHEICGDVKVWLPIWKSRSGALYFRTRNRNFKVHYDDGLNYQAQKNFKNAVIKGGANFISKNYCIDNRVRVNLGQKGETYVTSGHKFNWAKNGWTFDSVNVISYKINSLVKNAIRVGYKTKQYDVFVRAENDTVRNSRKLDLGNLDTYFTKVIFDYVHRFNDWTSFAVQTEISKKQNMKATIVLQKSTESKQSGIKIRVSNDKSVSLCFQRMILNYGKWTAGWEVSDLGNTNKCRYGLQIDLNL